MIRFSIFVAKIISCAALYFLFILFLHVRLPFATPLSWTLNAIETIIATSIIALLFCKNPIFRIAASIHIVLSAGFIIFVNNYVKYAEIATSKYYPWPFPNATMLPIEKEIIDFTVIAITFYFFYIASRRLTIGQTSSKLTSGLKKNIQSIIVFISITVLVFWNCMDLLSMHLNNPHKEKGLADIVIHRMFVKHGYGGGDLNVFFEWPRDIDFNYYAAHHVFPVSLYTIALAFTIASLLFYILRRKINSRESSVGNKVKDFFHTIGLILFIAAIFSYQVLVEEYNSILATKFTTYGLPFITPMFTAFSSASAILILFGGSTARLRGAILFLLIFTTHFYIIYYYTHYAACGGYWLTEINLHSGCPAPSASVKGSIFQREPLEFIFFVFFSILISVEYLFNKKSPP